MATYYVDFVNGNDANNGLGPDASHASNKPWKTIAKLLGAAGMASADTAYLAPGTFREAVTVAMTSAAATTTVAGDPTNAQGFKTSGGVLVRPGPVIWSTYLTDDKTPGAGGSCLTLAGRDFLSFSNIMFVTATASCVTQSSGDATNLTFTRCMFSGASNVSVITITNASVLNAAILFDSCVTFNTFGVTATLIRFPLNPTGNADYDIGVEFRNCFWLIGGGGEGIRQTTTGGSGTGKPGGMKIRNCTIWGGGTALACGANNSTTISHLVYNCILGGQSSTGINASVSGNFLENFNLITAPTPRTNVTAGANSQSGSPSPYALMWSFGMEQNWGFMPRQPFEPMAGSPLLGFGTDASVSLSVDFLGLPRPAGGASALKAIGTMERGNSFILDPSPIGAGGSAIKITGPGYEQFYVPVPARAITITCVVKWDATYAGTKPQLILQANPKIGVSGQTITAAGSSGSNETLTLAAFTPSAAGGMVIIRVQSNDTNGGGVLQVDDFTVTG